MSNFWKLVIWAMAMIAIALFGAFGIMPHELSQVLVIAIPALAFASLNGRNCFGTRKCA